jgi:hypothetical protein
MGAAGFDTADCLLVIGSSVFLSCIPERDSSLLCGGLPPRAVVADHSPLPAELLAIKRWPWSYSVANPKLLIPQYCHFKGYPHAMHPQPSLPQKCLLVNSVAIAVIGGGEEEIVAISKI